MRGTTASRGRHSIRPTIRGAFSGTVESGADLAYGTNKQKLGLIKVKGRPSVTYVMEGGYHFEDHWTERVGVVMSEAYSCIS